MKPPAFPASSCPRPPLAVTCHFKPYLTDLLQSLAVDVSYHRAQGNYLYHYDEAGDEVAVLDLVGGYGSLLLGHSHPEIVNTAQRLLTDGCVIHGQGSLRNPARELARELSGRCGGDYMAVFANSGAEAVEAAMKHAMLETGGRHFIALEGAFHGKTSGAVQLTANATYREGMRFREVPVTRVPVNDARKLRAAFEGAKELAGFIYEPIQGEGGVRPLDADYVQLAAELCVRYGVPLIADECQTGLGRTARFLASEHLGVVPDYVLLSKSLGGGVAKISAILVQRARYRDTFDLKHTSTYADDDFSCGIARKVLELVDQTLLRNCAEKGAQLLERLRQLAVSYPDIITDVRGQGLMIGVELRPLTNSRSFFLRHCSSQANLSFLVMGYLLRQHRIRIAPTLSDSFTLRLEPSAFIAQTDISRFLAAMEDVCARLSCGDAAALTAHLSFTPVGERLSDTREKSTDLHVYEVERLEKCAATETTFPSKVAWLCHMVTADDLIHLDEDFARVSAIRRERLLARLARRAEPVVLSSVDVRSVTGSVTRLYPIMVPFTSHWVKAEMETRRRSMARAMVQEGVDVAVQLGCSLVALGQYTSIVTRNGLSLQSRGLGLTTGNSYAVALALEAVQRALNDLNIEAEAATLVVAGAAGNIGRTCAACLAPIFRQTVLVGSSRGGSKLRLARLVDAIPRATLATDLSAVRQGHVVIAAMNAVDAPLRGEHLRQGAVVCDLSVPAALPPDVVEERPDLFFLRGGLVSLPGGEDLKIPGFPLPRGQTYGCMAEALLCGWEGIRDSSLIGALTPDHVHRVAAMASRHGLRLAEYNIQCVPGAATKGEFHAVTV